MNTADTRPALHRFDSIDKDDLPTFTEETTPRYHRGRYRYNAQVCAFDIETTGLPEIQQSVMYVWQFAIEDYVIIGRTWDELRTLFGWIDELSGGRRTVVYVHNLSYEFQFLSGIFHFNNEDVFSMDSRKVLKAVVDSIELRCSYLLTNLSLKALTKRYNVEHQKLSGEDFDYSIRRYSDTKLTDEELEYCINDVLGLVESIHRIMELSDDNLYSIPLTSTGYVRRVCKEAMRSEHLQIINSYPTYEVFKLLRKAFRGGNTHANRYYADEVISGPVRSSDITSSYPFQQVCKLFPVYPFEEVHSTDIHYIDRLIDRGKAVLFHVALSDVTTRGKYVIIPYIPLDKTMSLRNAVIDNGRILQASYLEIVVTDIDWQIIVKQYSFKASLICAYRSDYGRLPDGLRDSNIEFYKKKTELKGVKGQELYYMKNKELLNSIYGMSVQNPVKRSILFNDDGEDPELYVEDMTLTDEELLLRSKRKAFTCYQFGVWTTAHARKSLEDGIDICGDDLLYCDTDSCKYIGDHDFTAYNKEVQSLAVSGGLYATDIKGITHYGGVYEPDGEYSGFITQGAKKYAYVEDGKLHITVSGVGKRAGAEALSRAGGLDAFREGFVFHNCGKTESIYNDTDLGWINTDGRQVYVSRNVFINNQDYTLGRADDYTELLRLSKQDINKIYTHLKNLYA
ncbi:MAG: hypothetical protein IKY66_07465 [Bacteroidales bacterium]|nr:hypothetical protein [Bacteroidales bacterium]